jgi:hypothetical protein
MGKGENRTTEQEIKPWVVAAVASEDRKASAPLWKGAPTAQDAYKQRLQRVKFFRKAWATDLPTKDAAERLEACESGDRCCSGACPECARLLQRWFVRASKAFISENMTGNEDLVAASIVPARPIVGLGELKAFSSDNFQRRVKHALAKAEVGPALGGIDFSCNEDRDQRYKPFWSPHSYLITSAVSTTQTRIIRTVLNLLNCTKRTPKPIMVSPFVNKAKRRSYAVKITFDRPLGKVNQDGRIRRAEMRPTTDCDRYRKDLSILRPIA